MEHLVRPITVPSQNRRHESPEVEQLEVGGALERLIAQELGNEPYQLELNAASFSYMTKEELHELLDKILETVSPEKMESIYVAEDKTDKIVEFLEVLRYQPDSTDVDLENLRRGIENAETGVLIPLMAWLLANMPTLKTRAYLSKFLIKLKVPDEILCDEEFSILYDQYVAEIEKFKATHKMRESLLEKRPLSEVKDDVNLISSDIDCLRRKIEMVKAKVVRSGDLGDLIEVIRQHRFERQKQTDLLDQEAIESTREKHVKGRMEYLRSILHDLRETNDALTPRSLIEREQQEVANARFIAEEKLPKSIAKMRRKIKAIKTISENPMRNVNDLEDRRRKIHVLESEVKRLESELESVNSREVSKELSITRKKAEMVRSKRNLLREQMKGIEAKFETGKTKLVERSMEALAKKQRDEDDKEFIKSLRAKAKCQKTKKAELSSIRAELGNRHSYCHSLQERLLKSQEALEDYAKKHELEDGFLELREKLSHQTNAQEIEDGKKEDCLSQYSEAAMAIHLELEKRKESLEPLYGQVNNMRQQSRLLELEYDRSRRNFEQSQQNFDSESLKSELKKMEETVSEEEMKSFNLRMETKFISLELERAKEGDGSVGRQRSFKEGLLAKIVEQERIHRRLTHEKSDLEEKGQKSMDQQEAFRNVFRLFQCKKAALGANLSQESEL